MKVENGKLYLNRTWKYIYPALRVYGQETINYLNSLIKLSVGIEDSNYEHEDSTIPKIFILIQTQMSNSSTTRAKNYSKLVKEFFEYIKKQPFYVDDYLYDLEEDSCHHMIVLKFPDSFKRTYDMFLGGIYSEMYHKTIIENFFPITSLEKVHNRGVFNVASSLGNNLEIHKILKKDTEFKQNFLKIINEDFNTHLTLKDLPEEGEYDYPPVLKEEIFNFSEKSEEKFDKKVQEQ